MDHELLTHLPTLIRPLTEGVSLWGELVFWLILSLFLAVAIGSRIWAADERASIAALLATLEESQTETRCFEGMMRVTANNGRPVASRLREPWGN